MLKHWSQFIPNMSTAIRGHEALHHQQQTRPLNLNYEAAEVGQGEWENTESEPALIPDPEIG